MHADPVGLPSAQRVAALRILELQHFRAEIGELQAHHVAGDEARHVDDPHPVERTSRSRFERFLGHAHRSGPILPLTGSRIMLERILITNDNGIEAPGLALLERIAGEPANAIWVVATE